MMWTNKQFWLDSTWRSFRTFCQTLGAMLGGQAVNLLTAPWSSMLGVSLTAGLGSLLMSIDRERAVTSVEGTPENTPEIITSTAYEPPMQADYSGCGTDLR